MRALVENRTIDTLKVDGADNVADILTKNVTVEVFNKLIRYFVQKVIAQV